MAPRSTSELAAKLRQKGCPEDVATAVIVRLTEVGLLDDAAYAHMLVHQRSSQRGLARSALRRELAGKGVDRQVAEAAVGEVSEAAERLRAEDLVAKRLRTMSGLDPSVQARRLAAMLQRKGYPPGLTYAVVRDAIAALPEHERD
jgi:regulatory protein